MSDAPPDPAPGTRPATVQVEDIASWVGEDVVGPDDEKVGKLQEVYAEVGTTEPTIAVVKVGRLGGHHHVVPLADATFSRGQVRLPLTKEQVTAAPQVAGTDHLTRADEVAYAEHHGLPVVASEAPPDAMRYESGAVRRRRREAMDADLARAAEMEGEAARLGDEADSLEAQATDLAHRSETARRRQQELTTDAAAIRRGIDAAPSA